MSYIGNLNFGLYVHKKFYPVAKQVFRNLFENYEDETFGPYGFYDAFSPEHNWYPERYLAFDQGPIVVMIENHRSGLLWDLFMSSEEVQKELVNWVLPTDQQYLMTDDSSRETAS